MSRTYQPKKIKRRRTHGFLRKTKNRRRRRVLQHRRRKGRNKLAS